MHCMQAGVIVNIPKLKEICIGKDEIVGGQGKQVCSEGRRDGGGRKDGVQRGFKGHDQQLSLRNYKRQQ